MCWTSGLIQDRSLVSVVTLISISNVNGREKSKVPFKVLSLLSAMFISGVSYILCAALPV